jgi:uncharacterized protein with FMN-binding domain
MNNGGNMGRYIISAIVVLAVIAGVIGFAYSRGNFNMANSGNTEDVKDDSADQVILGTDNDGMDNDSGGAISTSSTATTIVTNKYKDGTYTAIGGYTSPGGPETITVTLVIRNDIIMDATVVGHKTNAITEKYQTKFITGYKSLVIGKNIDSLQLDKVSGSSLTPKGFNAALATIKINASLI